MHNFDQLREALNRVLDALYECHQTALELGVLEPTSRDDQWLGLLMKWRVIAALWGQFVQDQTCWGRCEVEIVPGGWSFRLFVMCSDPYQANIRPSVHECNAILAHFDDTTGFLAPGKSASSGSKRWAVHEQNSCMWKKGAKSLRVVGFERLAINRKPGQPGEGRCEAWPTIKSRTDRYRKQNRFWIIELNLKKLIHNFSINLESLSWE